MRKERKFKSETDRKNESKQFATERNRDKAKQIYVKRR